MANGSKANALGANPRESTKAKLREFADLYRGGPDEVRGKPGKCYAVLHPTTSKKGCESRGSEYLNHPYTQQYLKEQTDRVAEQADVTQERVIQEIARLGLFDPRKLFDGRGNPLPISQLDDDAAAAIAGLKVREIPTGDDGTLATVIEYKLADKNSALDKLMKYLGAYEKDNSQRAKSLAELIDEVRSTE